MSEQPQEQAFKFDVFISYRHADLDGAVAGYLQKSLEHYKIPKEIQKKCGKRNIQRVFRDEEELGAASDLFTEIEQNLKQSEFLVVICSPRILESKWCLREIETFIKYRDREHVLAVLVEGEPETAFPPILLEEGEPLAVDLRGGNKREVLHNAKTRMPRLAAPLLGCSYDELFQRRRVYMMRRALALAGLVTAVSLSFGAVTLMQSREIQRQSKEIQQQNDAIQQQNEEIQQNYQGKLENQSRYLAQLSGELLGQGNRDAALLVALEALPDGSGDTSRPYVAEARIALENALYTYAIDNRYHLQPLKILEHKGGVGQCCDYNEEENVLLTADTRIYVWDAATCENICCWEDETRPFEDAKLVGGCRVAALTEKGIFCFDYRSGEIVWEWTVPACDTERYCSVGMLSWDFDPNTGRIFCVNHYLRLHSTEDYSGTFLGDAHRIHLIDVATGESSAWTPAALYEPLTRNPDGDIYLSSWRFVLSPDGTKLALVSEYKERNGEDYETVYELNVFPVGEDVAVFTQRYTGYDSWLFIPVERIFWLDETTMTLIRTLEELSAFGHTAYPGRWALECWDISSGQMQFRHEDTFISIIYSTGSMFVQQTEVNSREEGAVTLVSAVYGNVEVCLDRYTGEVYSRVEDRSAIKLNHIWDTDLQVMVTADGYLFATIPTDDVVWAPIYDGYHYYLKLDDIKMAQWYDGKAFFFTEKAVYCYTPAADYDCTFLEGSPKYTFFTADGSHLFVMDYDGQAFLYETENFELLWQDEYLYHYRGVTGALAGDRYAVYFKPGAAQVQVRTMDGTVRPPIALDHAPPDLIEKDLWSLRSARETQVLAWYSDYVYVYDSSSHLSLADLDCTAVWLLDAEQGTAVEEWSYRELVEQFPRSMDMSWFCLYLLEPAVSGSGRYVVIPYRMSGYEPGDGSLFSRGDEFDQVHVTVWDRDAQQFLSLPEAALHGMCLKLAFKDYFSEDGWVSPQEDVIALYDEESKVIRVVDLTRSRVACTLTVDGIGSNEISFTPDGDHLIFQDSLLRLHVYNWKEGVYTMENVVPSVGSMSFSFWQDGQVLSAAVQAGALTTLNTYLYRPAGDGNYKQDTGISHCDACDGKTVVIADGSNSRLYHARSLDDLIAMARDILDGRELTPAERASYLID